MFVQRLLKCHHLVVTETAWKLNNPSSCADIFHILIVLHPAKQIHVGISNWDFFFYLKSIFFISFVVLLLSSFCVVVLQNKFLMLPVNQHLLQMFPSSFQFTVSLYELIMRELKKSNNLFWDNNKSFSWRKVPFGCYHMAHGCKLNQYNNYASVHNIRVTECVTQFWNNNMNLIISDIKKG